MSAGASTYRSYTVKDAVTVKKGELLTIQTSDGKLDLTTHMRPWTSPPVTRTTSW